MAADLRLGGLRHLVRRRFIILQGTVRWDFAHLCQHTKPTSGAGLHLPAPSSFVLWYSCVVVSECTSCRSILPRPRRRPQWSGDTRTCTHAAFSTRRWSLP